MLLSSCYAIEGSALGEGGPWLAFFGVKVSGIPS